MKITVSQHAVDRAIQHFRVDRRVAEEWVRSNAKKAEFIANIMAEDGKPCRLFAFQRITFIFAEVTDFIITLYPQDFVVTEIHAKIRRAVERELAKAERQEKTAVQRYNVERARIKLEQAQCRYRMAVTPSAKVIAANERKIAELADKLAQLDRELTEVKRAKTRVAKSVARYV